MLFVVFAGMHVLGLAQRQPSRGGDAPETAKARIWPAAFAASPAFIAIRLGGGRVEGAGRNLDLGRAAPAPGRILRDWLLGRPELVMPSCLTVRPPVAGAGDAARLPVRDDLPGFYGAPWTAMVAGNLVVLLDVTAPRDAALPVPGTTVQIYRDYDGRAAAPDFAVASPVRVYRGSAAVLYRVFAGAPLRCIDLVVPDGQPAGIGYLYYQRDRHYFEATARFVIQK